MKKIFLRDAENHEIMPELVRYFKYQSGGCLIYTFHEIDDNNFMTLYAVKVLEELGIYVSKYAFNDWEWQDMRAVVQSKLRELQNHNISYFEDLDDSLINGMRIVESRCFKILANYVDAFSGQSKEEFPKKKVMEIGLESRCLKKIQLLDQLKEKYSVSTKNISIFQEPILVEKAIVPVVEVEKEDTLLKSSAIKNDSWNQSPTAKKIVDSTITLEKYRKLQHENESLKQQILHYQKKYEEIMNLLNQDE